MCKQPSLVEGLDNAGAQEDTSQDQPTTISYSQSTDGPRRLQRSLSFDSADDNDVFEQRDNDGDEFNSDSVERRAESSEKTSIWLQRAMSLCSEGEDIEALASEAENDEFIDEVNFPKPLSEHEDKHNIRGHKGPQINVSDESSEKKQENQQSTEQKTVNVGGAENDSIDERQNDQDNLRTKMEIDTGKNFTSQTKGDMNKPNANSSNSVSGKSANEKKIKSTERYRFSPHVAVCAEDDYLFSAATVVRQALQCELDGQYKEAFHLYKKCVSLLLNGVQGENLF